MAARLASGSTKAALRAMLLNKAGTAPQSQQAQWPVCPEPVIAHVHYEITHDLHVRKVCRSVAGQTTVEQLGQYEWFQSDQVYMFVNGQIPQVPAPTDSYVHKYQAHRSHTPCSDFSRVKHKEVIQSEWSTLCNSLSKFVTTNPGRAGSGFHEQGRKRPLDLHTDMLAPKRLADPDMLASMDSSKPAAPLVCSNTFQDLSSVKRPRRTNALYNSHDFFQL